VKRFAFFGGIYSNHLALAEAISIAARTGVDRMFALGDFGAFGPHPDRTIEILRSHPIDLIQGNYEEALASQADDCHCGYTDPRDNRFAQISYDYTFANTSRENRAWMATLPLTRRIEAGGRRILLVHGSPRKINEFLWESTSPVAFLEKLLEDFGAEILVCTHTGLHWSRRLPSGKLVINCGALGRPANDGRTNVWFAALELDSSAAIDVRFVPVEYEHERFAREMEEERLPPEFIETIRTGWWTSCLEILPAKERARGRF
jgi:diadenosine tetraphosphatase ApaH/serine/threonine PP2A family protein phosphatase